MDRNTIKEIFIQATDLPRDEQEAFVRFKCGDNKSAVEEVLSLLSFHKDETIFDFEDDPSKHQMQTSKDNVVLDKNTNKWILKALSFFESLISSRSKRICVLSVSGIVVVILGFWAHYNIKTSLQDLRGEELKAVLDADVVALKYWINDKKEDAQRWATDPRIVLSTSELLKLVSPHGVDYFQLRNHKIQKHLMNLYIKQFRPQGYENLSIVGRDGTILFSTMQITVGRSLNAMGMATITPVFSGESVFVKPFVGGKHIDERGGVEKLISCAFLVPIYNTQGRIVAAFTITQNAYSDFTKILSVARLGLTGETVAFDEEGRNLSESRFTELLAQKGLLLDDNISTGVLNFYHKDPGKPIHKVNKPIKIAGKEFTLPVRMALASRMASIEEQEGILTEPYNNYRGVKVIGAWKWLDELDLGVLTEMDAKEAFAPLFYLRVTLGVVFFVLLIFAAIALINTLVIVRLKSKLSGGEVLGPYNLLKKIGEGGMGRVYLAKHNLMKRPTAVKVLKEEVADDEVISRFEREVQLASQLSHPNTIEIYDFGHTSEGVFYYAMEYIQGISLFELLKLESHIPLCRAIYILKQICYSLREAHSLGLLHRDIKPMNIMLTKRGGEFDIVKVLDFGLAKKIDQNIHSDLTVGKKISGTPMYMSPERLRGSKDVDTRADIYSLGCVAYNLITGKPIFSSINELDTLYHVMNLEPKPIMEQSSQDVPEVLQKIIMSSLQKEMNNRPSNIQEWIDILEDLSIEYRWSQKQAELWWDNKQLT